jgi:hypothetical protein
VLNPLFNSLFGYICFAVEVAILKVVKIALNWCGFQSNFKYDEAHCLPSQSKKNLKSYS